MPGILNADAEVGSSFMDPWRGAVLCLYRYRMLFNMLNIQWKPIKQMKVAWLFLLLICWCKCLTFAAVGSHVLPLVGKSFTICCCKVSYCDIWVPDRVPAMCYSWHTGGIWIWIATLESEMPDFQFYIWSMRHCLCLFTSWGMGQWGRVQIWCPCLVKFHVKVIYLGEEHHVTVPEHCPSGTLTVTLQVPEAIPEPRWSIGGLQYLIYREDGWGDEDEDDYNKSYSYMMLYVIYY